MKPLGKTQLYMMESLKESGSWSTGDCGWLWDTPSGTIRILESLVKRDLVEKQETDRFNTTYTLKKESNHDDKNGS